MTDKPDPADQIDTQEARAQRLRARISGVPSAEPPPFRSPREVTDEAAQRERLNDAKDPA